jgi:serralysin
MTTTTTDPLNSLLAIRDGNLTSRWNFPDAVGTLVASSGGIGNAATVTYSFLTSIPSYYSSSPITGFVSFSALQQQAVRDILVSIANVTHLNFTEVTGVGTMTFGMNTQAGSAGYAYYPSFNYGLTSSIAGVVISSVTAQPISGDVWLNSSQSWVASDFALGGQGYGTLVHEIGHALGLKHSFEATSPSGYTLDASLDNNKYTVMSYNDHPYNLYRTVTQTSQGSWWQYEYIQPETLMPLDITALQYLYGANTSFHSGNDTYTFDTSRPFIKTIWDGGGNDTISVSNFTLGCVIDLRAGYYSSIRIPSNALPLGATESHTNIYDGTDNLAIAAGTIIENAIGGSDNDTLIGNSANNALSGGSGIDTMTGGLGDDSYAVSDTGDVVVENLNEGTDTVSSRASTYTLAANVENLILTGTAAINGTGNALNNQITGNSADNVISGGSGIDTMTGGLGNDSYSVSDTTDVVVENLNEGTDTVSSRASTYTLAANVENLILTGTAAINGTGNALNNQITGNSADNVISGGSGIDIMTGGLGNDSYSVSDTTDVVIENLNEGTDTVSSRAISYTLAANVENLTLTGTAAIDGTGNALNNQLTGNSANNVLIGGLGKDTYHIAEATAVTDTLGIATGDSLVSSFDIADGFKLGTGASPTTAGVDRLDLSSILITANGIGNGADVGSGANAISSHSITGGIIHFDSLGAYDAPVTVTTATNLANVLSYLQANITGGNSVAFIADTNNTYVFQDGGVTDTLVELVGVNATSVSTTGSAAGAVWIV